MPAILVPLSCCVFLLTSHAISRLTLMLLLRPMSYISILYMCLFIRAISSPIFLPQLYDPYVLSLRDVLKKYTIPPWFFCFFLFFFANLGGESY
ncbi:hypothetical protein BJV74DRAFT_29095 [Russula compacta]|nr:hypothetical protein BJV74DRAFT_29095 [Russula compacta]